MIVFFVCQRRLQICIRLQFTQSLSEHSITLLSISSSCFFSLRIYRRRKKESLHYSAAVHKLYIHTVFRRISENSIAILENIQIRNLQVRSFYIIPFHHEILASVCTSSTSRDYEDNAWNSLLVITSPEKFHLYILANTEANDEMSQSKDVLASK